LKQKFTADFSSHWGGRRNGWEKHAVIFGKNIRHNHIGCKEEELFCVDSKTGTVKVLKNGVVLSFEVWWRGRAPWDYLNVRLTKGLCYDGNGAPSLPSVKPVDDNSGPSWSMMCSRPGHLLLRGVKAQIGDIFNVIHEPAHMQGSPAVCELVVEASTVTDMPAPNNTTESLRTSSESLADVQSKAVKQGFALQPIRPDGQLPIELFKHRVNVPKALLMDWNEQKGLYCIYHARHHRNPSEEVLLIASSAPSSHNCSVCEALFSPEAIAEDSWWVVQIETQDQVRFGDGNTDGGSGAVLADLCKDNDLPSSDEQHEEAPLLTDSNRVLKNVTENSSMDGKFALQRLIEILQCAVAEPGRRTIETDSQSFRELVEVLGDGAVDVIK